MVRHKASEKVLYVIGGVNGAGKSTFTDATFGSTDIKYINVDRMAMEMFGDYSTESNIKAGKEAINILNSWPKTRKPIVWESVLESVLEGSFFGRTVNLYKKHGYMIDLTYLFLEDQETHLERIRNRVENGGHDISTTDVIRRFHKRSKNFIDSSEMSDSWRLLCNQNPWFELVAFGHGPTRIVSNFELFSNFYDISGNARKFCQIKKLLGFSISQKKRALTQ